jgi:hypothetical protein
VPYADFSDPQSLNLYAYVRNVPTSQIDGDGHCPGPPCFYDSALIGFRAASRVADDMSISGSTRGFLRDLGIGAAKGTGSFVYHALMSSNPITMVVDHFVGEPKALQGSNQTQNDAKVLTVVTETIGTMLLPGPKGAAVEGEGAGANARLPQDINVNPRAPAANNGSGTVGPSVTQNAAADADAAAARAAGHTDIRKNQQQVNAQGQRVGVNRPDLQSTDANGVRHYTEYDRSAQSAANHHARTAANDPNGVTHTKIGP